MDTKFFVPLCTPIRLLLNITESDRKSQTLHSSYEYHFLWDKEGFNCTLMEYDEVR